MKSFLIAFILIISLNAAAQDTTLIVPNGKIVQGNSISPYHKQFDMFRIKEGKEEKTGVLTDEYKILKESSSQLGLRIIHIKLASFEILDSGCVNAQTLQPVYHRSHQTNKIIALDFNNNAISGIVQSGENSEAVNVTYDTPFFDSYFENFIAAGVPLKKDFTFKFAEFIDNKTGLVWSSGQVSKLKDKMWIVKLYENRRGRVTTFWLDSKRQILQWEYNFNGNISRTRLAGVDQI